MAKAFSAPLARTARLLDLVPYLNSHQGISIQDLSKTFEVTPTQMISDLTTLWMCGLPGYTPLELMDLDFDSGYVTIRNAPTLSKPRSITFDEGVALLLGLDLVRNALPEERSDLINVVDTLSTRISRETGIPKTIKVSGDKSSAALTSIDQAFKAKSGISIKYHSLYSDSITDRVVRPIEMYEADGNQYLRAFCFSAQGLREFRVDRILDIKIVEIENEIPKINAETAKIQYSIRLDQPSRDSIERFGLSVDSRDEVLSSYSKQWIQRSVIASGGEVELMGPSDIRHEISQKAQLMLDRYKED